VGLAIWKRLGQGRRKRLNKSPGFPGLFSFEVWQAEKQLFSENQAVSDVLQLLSSF
jgi:hypothetical protein